MSARTKQSVFLVAVLGAFLMCAAAVHCQQCRGLEPFDFARNRAFTLPARVESFDGLKLTGQTRTESKTLVRVEPFEFTVDEKSEFPRGFDRNYKSGLYTIVYCRDTLVVLWVQRFIAAPKDFETKAEMDQRLAKLRNKVKQ